MNLFTQAAMIVLAGTALATTNAAPSHGSRTKSPNDIICKETPMSGSRLDAKRVCMTRLQWEDMRRDARDTIDKAQRQQVQGHP